MNRADRRKRPPELRRQTFIPVTFDGKLDHLQAVDDIERLSHHYAKSKPDFANRVLVTIATIPQRRESCENLLRALTYQTMPIHVRLILDGYEGHGWPRLPSNQHLSVTTHCSSIQQGAGYRWRLLERIAKESLGHDFIVVNIDDDMLLAPNAIEQTVLELVGRAGGSSPKRQAIGWCGFSDRPECHELVDEEPAILKHVATHSFAMFVEDIIGIRDVPDADLLLGVQGDDELIVSRILKEKGIEIHRPAGRAPFWNTPAQEDAHAQHKNPRSQAVRDAINRTRAVIYG